MKNLVSVGQIVEQGMQVPFNHGGCFIEKEGRLIARGWQEGQMFILHSHEMKSTMFAKGHKADSNIELWHKRNNHINLHKLKSMQSKGVVIGLPMFKEKEIDDIYATCQFGKQHWPLFPKEINVRKSLLDIIHSDMWGPAQTTTFGWHWYYVTFINDFSRHSSIFLMRKKSEVFSHLQKFKSNAEKEMGR